MMRFGGPLPLHTIPSSSFPTPMTAFFSTPSSPAAFAQSTCLFLSKGRTPPLVHSRRPKLTISATANPNRPPLDLTEDNVKEVLNDARVELGQIFDGSVGITGIVELAELDGPYVKISLKGRFWHQRSMVVARLANYLKQRIPEILEVEIEDEKQLDDSPASF